MVDLLCALDLRRLMREVLVDGEVEAEAAVLVHAFIRLDRECEVEDIIGVWEVGLHRTTKGEFREVYWVMPWCVS